MLEIRLRETIDLLHRNLVHPYLTHGEAQKDREIAHERALELAEKIQDNPAVLKLFSETFSVKDPILKTNIGGIKAPNPLGIPAGFDKNARIHKFLGKGLGSGIVVVGSVTTIPYKGNDRPRIFDLPLNDGLINRMGYPGDGTDIIENRLKKDSDKRNYALIINVAASKPSFEQGSEIEDYGAAFSQMLPYGDGCEVNVSSPNTKGVTGLQEPERFEQLASHIATIRKVSPYKDKPLFYKFGPDLPLDKLEKDLEIAIDHGANGVTLTNTSTSKEIRDALIPEEHSQEIGGMSGLFLGSKSLNLTHRIYECVGESLVILRAGGIRGTAEDLWEALTYGGATAAFAYSSFVRQTTSTPNFNTYALKGLAKAMRIMGMKSTDDFKALRGRKVPFPL